MSNPPVSTAASLVLGGGIALGAFQVGAFETLASAPGIDIRSVSGASIGALNGAIIAGNPPETRLARLKSFWEAIAVEALPALWLDPLGLATSGPLRRMRNWSNALTTALVGNPRLFTPRTITGGRGEARSLYDNRAAITTLRSVIDFGRLNSGGIRFCLAATDVDAGEALFFDTAKGDRIEIEHLLASSSLLPAFEPVRIGDRLLADGGLACNLPFEAEIGDARSDAPLPLCFALDLYTAGGGQPFPLNRATDASIDLFFGMQSRMRLRSLERQWELERQLCEARSQAAPPLIDLFYLSYHGSELDAGPGKPFDFSPATLADRMAEGRAAARRALDMRDGLAGGARAGLHVHEVGSDRPPAAAR